jgi:hypothetical protein
MKNTDKIYLVVQNDINELYEYIVYVYDNRIQDIELLGLVIYDMCHNKLM